MKNRFKKIALIILLISVQNIFGQYLETKVRDKHKAYTDSLKQVEYTNFFPIGGQFAYKKGFDIPYPTGLMVNYIWMSQGLTFSNFQLGVKTDTKDIPLTEINFIEFGENTNVSQSYNVRPDLWVLPFLNVYGLFGVGNTRTEVEIVAPIAFKSIVEQSISTKGFGVMAAGGIGPVWFSVDANWTWNKPELLDEAVRVNVLGLRLGRTFTFKQRPDRNFAVWVGGMRAKTNSETRGEIKMIDALPEETWARKDEIVSDYYSWYGDLDPVKDRAKIKVADEVLTPFIENIDARNGETIIRYGMDKQLKQLWNGVLGAQFQLNKHWQFRTEAGLVGDRKSFLISINYRFLL